MASPRFRVASDTGSPGRQSLHLRIPMHWVQSELHHASAREWAPMPWIGDGASRKYSLSRFRVASRDPAPAKR